jgi:hypothetical protein
MENFFKYVLCHPHVFSIKKIILCSRSTDITAFNCSGLRNLMSELLRAKDLGILLIQMPHQLTVKE